MFSIAARFLSLVLLALGASLANGDIRDSDTHKLLSLADGGPVLSLPREDWTLSLQRMRQDRAVVYYMLTSERHRMSFSVYINSVPPSKDPGVLRDASMKNPAYGAAKLIEHSESGPYKLAYFVTELPVQSASQRVQTHIQASAIVGEHWFDIHISAAARNRTEKAVLLEILKSITIQPQ